MITLGAYGIIFFGVFGILIFLFLLSLFGEGFKR